MSDLDVDAIVGRLAAGESVDASMLLGLDGGAERELLKRCAALRIFDDELVEALRDALPGDPPDAHLSDLIRAGSVERVPGRRDCWRLPAAVRRKHYLRWWRDHGDPEDVPEDLEKLSAAALTLLRRRKGEEVEALFHELIVNPEDAVGTFETLYEEADGRDDLARCQELLDVLGDRLGVLGPELALLRNEYRRRLRIRAMWLDDWYRSGRLLIPEASRTALEALLEGRHGRVLALWGGGGMGKTSHLRWLIARRCAPDGDACARLDFDSLEPLVATREPWLMLLEIAAQLDSQLPDAPLNELLAQYPGQRERLRRRPSATPATDADVEQDVFERLTAGLQELPAGRRAVIVVDTLEEALLLGGSTREQSPLVPLLEQLAELKQAVPALRLVLAGRDDPRTRIPGFETLFPGAATQQIEPFSAPEARLYLTEYRGITRDDVVERIVARTDGIALKLELIADVAAANPTIDAAEIDRAFKQTDLRYVMKRIVGRLDDELAQMLRYAVAPRVLDREFAGKVLARFLPVKDAAELDRLWKRLKRYAGSASWVTLDPLETDVVSFHPAVLEPMRALLRERPQHDEIHRRAAELFAQRAERRPSEASRWLQEAIYHRFQLEGPQAERYWLGLLADARVERHSVRRRALAAEVLRPDYVDEDGRPVRWRGGRPLIRPATVLRARSELAVASAKLALDSGTSERREAEWLEAERTLEDLEHLRARNGSGSAVSEAQLALVRATIALGARDLAEARRQMDRALRGRLHPEDRLWLRLAYATRASRRGRADASKQFEYALAFVEGANRDADRAEVHLRIAEHHAEHDRLDRAIRACRQAEKTARGRQALEAALLRAQLTLRCGAPSEALDVLARIKDDEPETVARVGILRVRALLTAWRPAEAVAVAEATRARLGDAIERGDSSLRWLAAEGRELRGKARAMLLDEEGAKRDLDWAAARWSRLGAGAGVCRCSVRIAALDMRGMGNLREASARLDQARRTDAERGDDAWTRCTLVGAELQARKDDVAHARRLVDDVIGELERRARPPRALIEAALCGLAISDGETADRYLELLCEQLGRITPETARLTVLEGLDRCDPPRDASPELLARLRDLVPSPLSDPRGYAWLAPRDRALLLLRDADLDRVVGRVDAARRSLGEAQKPLARDGSRALLGPAIRCNARSIVARVARRELAARRRSPTLLDGAVALEAAAQLLDTRDGARLLERADEILDAHGASSGRWLAWLQEVHGIDAERRHDDQQARARFEDAAALYSALEDDIARDRALKRTARDPWLRSALVTENELRVTVRLRDAGLMIEARAKGRQEGEPRAAAASELVRELLEAPPAAAGRAAAPATVERILADPAAVGRDLAALLRDAVRGTVERRADGQPIQIGLRCRDTAVRALPWELALPELEPDGFRLWRRAPRTRGEPGDVRALQGAMNRLAAAGLAEDGILGQRTRAALERIQPRLGVPVTAAPNAVTEQRLHAELAGGGAPRVVIVRPTRRAEELTFRGSRQGGVAIDWAYQRVGFAPDVLDAPTPDELRDELHARPAAIVHLTAGLVNHHGTAAVDLLAAARTTERPLPAGRLTGTALDRLIPRNLPTPLLILDVPAPRSPRESVMQLLLRNAFAAELVAVGTVRAVLATGLAGYVRQQRLYDKLIRALAEGPEVGELARGLQAAAGPDFEDRLAFAATALFARTPWVRFPGTSAR